MFDERKTNEGISQAKSTDSKANDQKPRDYILQKSGKNYVLQFYVRN